MKKLQNKPRIIFRRFFLSPINNRISYGEAHFKSKRQTKLKTFSGLFNKNSITELLNKRNSKPFQNSSTKTQLQNCWIKTQYQNGWKNSEPFQNCWTKLNYRTAEQNSIAELLNIVKQFQNCVQNCLWKCYLILCEFVQHYFFLKQTILLLLCEFVQYLSKSVKKLLKNFSA